MGDLARLHEFLAPVNRRAAAHVLQSLTKTASRLLDQPRIGEKLEQYSTNRARSAESRPKTTFMGRRAFLARSGLGPTGAP